MRSWTLWKCNVLLTFWKCCQIFDKLKNLRREFCLFYLYQAAKPMNLNDSTFFVSRLDQVIWVKPVSLSTRKIFRWLWLKRLVTWQIWLGHITWKETREGFLVGSKPTRSRFVGFRYCSLSSSWTFRVADLLKLR